MLNCLLDNKDSVGKANSMRIVIENDKITFNMHKFINSFLNKVKNPEKLQKAFAYDQKEVFSKSFVDNHFNFSLSSPKYPEKNITKNFTSSENIKVINKDGVEEEINCFDKFNPNLKGQIKDNFLTISYELNKQETVIKKVPINMVNRMQNFSQYVRNSIIDDKDKQIVYFKNGKFYKKESSPTVEEYTKEYKISVYEKIKYLKGFEKAN